MSEHEATRTVPGDPQQVFAVASDVRRLPDWLPTVGSATPADDDVAGPPTTTVRVEGEGRSGHYATDGFWRPSEEQLRVEWGTPSRGGEGGGYAGWLQVHDRADGSSDVTAHLLFFETEAPADVDEGLERSLEALAGLCGG